MPTAWGAAKQTGVGANDQIRIGLIGCRSMGWGDLMDALDTWIPEPKRDTDKPFLMAVEDVFSITGRGTVATGRIERGKVHVGDPLEIIGFRDTLNTVATGIEMFRKLLDEG